TPALLAPRGNRTVRARSSCGPRRYGGLTMAPDEVRVGLGRAQGGQVLYRDGWPIGFVISRRSGADALDVEGRHLGRFTTEEGAARAILMANVAGPPDA